MTDFIDAHEPTPDFRASLEREIARAYRSGLMSQSPTRPRAMHIGTIIGIAAGAVMMLTMGLVLGASTGYASAESIVRRRGDEPLPPAAVLAGLKVPPISFTCSDPSRVAQFPPVKPAVQGVPVIELPAATRRSSIPLKNPLGIRALSSGSLLVNDAGARQIKLFDSTLSEATTVRDSAAGSSNSYGPRPVPLIQYLGDSSLLADNDAGSLLVLGPTGQVARAMAPAHPGMLLGLNLDFGGVDDRGRIVFSDHLREPPRGIAGGVGYAPESSAVIRVDFDARHADTLARVKTWPSTMMVRMNGGPVRFTSDPAPLIDEWAMLSDGSIAIVRGQDYHIDWIHADGAAHSTQKLPFDWKRLTDVDKQRLIDSVREVESPKLSIALSQRRAGPPPDDGAGGVGRSGGRGNGGAVIQGPPVPVEYVPPPLDRIFDYYPPIRRHALMPDLDGNLWILPTSTAQSKHGELVYDVVNVRGGFHRVRIPPGRSVIGFGRGGLVFLQAGDKTNGFYLERTTVPR
ncbi:MAG TPA: hypothetical protein VH277_11995 [Gemmatimonadaceae bacterium]|jgi:hypothetical protein|nr:hypothetical protein [Gemmatimonadaceae bacterium]